MSTLRAAVYFACFVLAAAWGWLCIVVLGISIPSAVACTLGGGLIGRVGRRL